MIQLLLFFCQGGLVVPHTTAVHVLLLLTKSEPQTTTAKYVGEQRVNILVWLEALVVSLCLCARVCVCVYVRFTDGNGRGGRAGGGDGASCLRLQQLCCLSG